MMRRDASGQERKRLLLERSSTYWFGGCVGPADEFPDEDAGNEAHREPREQRCQHPFHAALLSALVKPPHNLGEDDAQRFGRRPIVISKPSPRRAGIDLEVK